MEFPATMTNMRSGILFVHINVLHQHCVFSHCHLPQWHWMIGEQMKQYLKLNNATLPHIEGTLA